MPEWSPYQQNIFDFNALDEGPPGAVNAVAGAGKTVTTCEAVNRRKSSALVVAFNRHIADELKRRLGTREGLDVSTLHALGLRTLAPACNTKPTVDTRKYDTIAQWALEEYSTGWAMQYETAFEARMALKQLIEFARLSLRDPLDPLFPAAAACYALEAPDCLLPLVAACLKEGAAEAKHDGVIDFSDMIWLPHRWDLQVNRYPVVYVDEVQDLNPAQLDLILRSRAPNARGLLVGDPAQSIMAFSFAGLNSFNEARDAIGARELPLSICYRCPTTHLALARELVPHIQPRDGAPAGVIVHCFDDELSAKVLPGDMVLCRYTAPLIRQCVQFIRDRVRAYVRGRDIGAGMVGLIDKVQRRDPTYTSFPRTLASYELEQQQKFDARRAPMSVRDMLRDRAECVRIVYAWGHPDWNALKRACQDICADNGNGVCLSTVHRAKGLEADRVWLLHPELLERFTDPQSRNVRYVSLTRSKLLLGFVHPTDHNIL